MKEFFDDCIPHVYGDVLPDRSEGTRYQLCDAIPERNPAYRFQQFVRCRQDVFEQDCDQQLEWNDLDEYTRTGKNTAGLVAGTALMAVPNFVARTVFDWPVNLSPTRSSYKEGIGTSYGLYPRSASALTKTPGHGNHVQSRELRQLRAGIMVWCA